MVPFRRRRNIDLGWGGLGCPGLPSRHILGVHAAGITSCDGVTLA